MSDLALHKFVSSVSHMKRDVLQRRIEYQMATEWSSPFSTLPRIYHSGQVWNASELTEDAFEVVANEMSCGDLNNILIRLHFHPRMCRIYIDRCITK